MLDTKINPKKWLFHVLFIHFILTRFFFFCTTKKILFTKKVIKKTHFIRSKRVKYCLWREFPQIQWTKQKLHSPLIRLLYTSSLLFVVPFSKVQLEMPTVFFIIHSFISNKRRLMIFSQIRQEMVGTLGSVFVFYNNVPSVYIYLTNL